MRQGGKLCLFEIKINYLLSNVIPRSYNFHFLYDHKQYDRLFEPYNRTVFTKFRVKFLP